MIAWKQLTERLYWRTLQVTRKRLCELCQQSLNVNRIHSFPGKGLVMGIETSCDDTGCAILDTSGNILGESLNSQQQIHLNHGGIIPPIARDLHLQNIQQVVQDALSNAKIQPSQLDAIATTVKPGLPLSLLVGMKYGKHLSRKYNKPFIPIHHMEAHALTIRMVRQVDFPFLVLLISGGHCLLAVAKSVDSFLLLGQSLDDAPGEAFDKTARRLKLHNLPDFSSKSGGHAIELAASKGDPLAFEFRSPLSRYRDCNFSMAGLKNAALRHILRQERKHDIEADGIIPGVFDLCASFQLAITRHLCHRVQRAMEYINLHNMLGENKILVVSGGVACNGFISRALEVVCEEIGYTLAVPPPKLCTDNGVMIAWNGVERWKAGVGVAEDLDQVDMEPKCQFGEDISESVADANIKCNWVKVKKLLERANVVTTSEVSSLTRM